MGSGGSRYSWSGVLSLLFFVLCKSILLCLFKTYYVLFLFVCVFSFCFVLFPCCLCLFLFFVNVFCCLSCFCRGFDCGSLIFCCNPLVF